jgi:hypothetical protein
VRWLPYAPSAVLAGSLLLPLGVAAMSVLLLLATLLGAVELTRRYRNE